MIKYWPLIVIVSLGLLSWSWNVYDHSRAESQLNRMAKFAPKYGVSEERLKDWIKEAGEGMPKTEADVRAEVVLLKEALDN